MLYIVGNFFSIIFIDSMTIDCIIVYEAAFISAMTNDDLENNISHGPLLWVFVCYVSVNDLLWCHRGRRSGNKSGWVKYKLIG